MPSDFCQEHYSFECGCEPTPAPSPPPSVWVVVELYTKSVQIGKGPSTSPVMGKAAIFQRPEVTQQLAGRIVGVFETEVLARAAIPYTEPGTTEFLVERHEVRTRTKVEIKPQKVDPERYGVCITCRAPSATSYCKRCEQERFAAMRERDMGIITEQVPASA